jgi:hypothetical protein
MEIPESINTLTVESSADQFAITTAQQQVILDNIIKQLRQQLPYQDNKALDEGIAFYKKDIISDKNFIKNICYLFNDALIKAIQSSTINDENKSDVSNAITTTINGIIQNIDAMYGLARNLNGNKNIIDVQKISCIILGYVTDIIKRKNNTKS